MASPAPFGPSDRATIAVVIPVYGKRQQLVRAVDSALSQDGVTVDLILVDDGSPDDPFRDLGERLSDPRVRVVRHAENRHVSAARNSGVQASSAPYVAFLDSDDEWLPGNLSRHLAAARAMGEPERFFSACRSLRITAGDRQELRPARGLKPGERPGDYIYVAGAQAQTSSFFVSRPLALAFPFDERLRQYEDHLFFIAAMESGAAYHFVDQPGAIYHDEETEGRLSGATTVARADCYESIAAPLLSRRAMLAFRARYRARILLDTAPGAALALVVRALLGGALRPRYLAGFVRLWWKRRG